MKLGIYTSSDFDTVAGRVVASLEFLHAVAASKDVELTVFADNLDLPGLDIYPVQALPALLPKFDVLHDLAFGFMPQLCELRNHLKAETRITGQLHSLAAPGYWALLRDPVLTSNDAVFTPSKAYHQLFQNLAPTSPLQRMFAPLGINATLCPTIGRLLNLEEQLQRAANTIVVMTMGRFSALTKQDLAPVRDALEILRARHPQIDIVHLAAGTPTGEGYEHVVAQWPRTVVFDATQIRDRKSALYSSANIFVAPATNIQESFGLAPVEAMACGLPVVATAFSGHRDTVAAAGILVPVEKAQEPPDMRTAALRSGFDYFSDAVQLFHLDPVRLADAIEPLLLHPQLRRQLGANAAAHGATYHWPQRISAFVDHWRTLCAAPFVPPTNVPDLDHAALFAPLVD